MKGSTRIALCLLAVVSLLVAAAPVRAVTGAVFTVYPNGMDDTAALQQAFNDAISAGAGSTVQLVEGVYHTGLINAFGFNGAFLGKGMDKTIIRALPDMVCDVSSIAKVPTLFKFMAYNLTISSLSIEVLVEKPCLEYEFYEYGPSTVLESMILLSGGQPFPPADECMPVFSQPVNIVIDKVSLKGSNGDWPTYATHNVMHGVEMWDYCQDSPPDGKWSLKFTRSRIEHTYFGFSRGWLRGLNLKLGGSLKEGNTFKTVGNAIYLVYNRNVVTEDSHNVMQDVFFNGLLVYASGADQLNYHRFHHNTVEVADIGNGVWIEDNIGLPTLSVEISRNNFLLTGPYQWGIVGAVADHLLVSNNHIRGSGDIGVLAGDPGYFGFDVVTASNWLIRANNVETAEFAWAPIVLGYSSASCVVIGSDNATNVVDLGTDNILTGVNNAGQKLGQISISKMMQLTEIKELVQRMR